MSAYRFWTLTCDECGEISDAGTSWTKTEARRYARLYGWTTPDKDSDICGLCNGTHERYGDTYMRVKTTTA